MQITEVTDLGLRAAAITLRRDETPMEFLLRPMMHIAERVLCGSTPRAAHAHGDRGGSRGERQAVDAITAIGAS